MKMIVQAGHASQHVKFCKIEFCQQICGFETDLKKLNIKNGQKHAKKIYQEFYRGV